MSVAHDPIISCEHVSFRYDRESVLEDVSFVVRAGEYVGIVGPNGSGKTTLLRIILGLIDPTEGEVRIFGKPIREFREWNAIGYVPQNVFRGDVAFPATVAEVVESGHLGAKQGALCQFGTGRCEAVDRALERSGISDLKKKRIGELSGGQRQRVFIARALVSDPKLLVLDEPTTGIDAASEEQFYDFLAELNRSGLTILLVSHDLEAIGREVGTVLCLNRRMVCYGAPKELQSAEVLREMYGRGKQMIAHAHPHDHEH